mmetsp:Transcript_3972/g.5789  ORF Transcript_3972/g.5789 Transcript_3972/m.5789 type:complete len:94 (+) Transcript_3972:291-572(+)
MRLGYTKTKFQFFITAIHKTNITDAATHASLQPINYFATLYILGGYSGTRRISPPDPVLNAGMDRVCRKVVSFEEVFRSWGFTSSSRVSKKGG